MIGWLLWKLLPQRGPLHRVTRKKTGGVRGKERKEKKKEKGGGRKEKGKEKGKGGGRRGEKVQDNLANDSWNSGL